MLIAIVLLYLFLRPIRKGLKSRKKIEEKGSTFLLSTIQKYNFRGIFSTLFQSSNFIQPSRTLRLFSQIFNTLSVTLRIFIFFFLFLVILSNNRNLMIGNPFGTPLIEGQQVSDVARAEFTLIYIIQTISSYLIALPLVLGITSWISNRLRNISDLINRKNISKYRELDPRMPFLFLRSFKQNQVRLGKDILSPITNIFFNTTGPGNLDSLLESKFWHLAPIYGVADPDSRKWAEFSGSLKERYSASSWFVSVRPTAFLPSLHIPWHERFNILRVRVWEFFK